MDGLDGSQIREAPMVLNKLQRPKDRNVCRIANKKPDISP